MREYLFGKHTGQPGLMQFAAGDFRAAEGDSFSDESNKLNLFYRMQTVFCYEEVMAYAENSSQDDVQGSTPAHPDIFYPSVGLFLSRNNTFSIAVKAGDNADSHNHNDTGSITIYKQGHPILVDIGVESYTAKTFSSRRYEIWTMQSGYHNLPTINGLDQHDGEAYRATNVVTSLDDAVSDPAVSWISMELSDAYPFAEHNASEQPSYHRTVTFDKEQNTITLTDATDSRDVILNFITYYKPELTGNTVKIGNALLSFTGAEHMTTETLPITDKRLQTAWDHDLYRIRLRMTDDTFTMNIN